MMKPEIGKICTYIKDDGEAVAAVIVGVLQGEDFNNNEVNLDCREGKFGVNASAVRYDENQEPNTWSYLGWR